MAKGRPKQKLTAADAAVIRNVLGMGLDDPWPMCPGTRKDGERCRNIAGSGTHGDWYGIGRPELGSFGTGFCSTCGSIKRMSNPKKKRVQKEHMEAIISRNTVSVEKFEQTALVEAKRATENLEVADAITTVRGVLARVEELDNDESLSIEANLKLKLQAAKQLNELGKTMFEFSRDLHIPVDVVKIWVQDVINILQQVTATRDDYEKGVKMLKQAITRTRNPNFMSGGMDATAETMPKRAE